MSLKNEIVLICKREEIQVNSKMISLAFPRTAGNTGNSRELLVIPGNYWEIGLSPPTKF